jgi:hypothetical protein
VVEGARLESVYTGNGIAGSNPAPSATISVILRSALYVLAGSEFRRAFRGFVGVRFVRGYTETV